MRLTRITILFAMALPMLAGSLAAAQPFVFSARQQLATEFMRGALAKASENPPSTGSLELATIMAAQAIELDANDVELCRYALAVAMTAENDELKAKAVDLIAQLDPRDEVVRLMRINRVLDRNETVQERIDAYQHLLSPQSVAALGRPTASRLAFDLALLHQRSGNTQQFAQWITESLKFDPANRMAAAVAAGFFRMNVDDALGEAELLINLLVADPTDITTQVLLGQLLLENAAYAGAERIYRLALRGMAANSIYPPNDLLADYVVAQWAKGDAQGALATLRKRQSELDQAVRDVAKARDPDMSSANIASLKGPTHPTHAALAAAIHVWGNDPEQEAAVATAVAAYESLIEAATEQNQLPATIAWAHLELAWVMIWLDRRPEAPDRVSALLERATQLQELSDEAVARFQGWVALRKGEPERAQQLLAPIAAQDVAARLGLAQAFLAAGNQREAAHELLAVNRAQPGSIMGVWAGNQLQELLGRRVPLSDLASKLETLVASLTPQIDRVPDDASLAVGLRMTPRKTVFDAFEPILIDVEISNRSAFPLGIDRDGPLRNLLFLAPIVRSPDAPQVGETTPAIIDIGRRFTLSPQQSFTITLDLRRTAAGGLLNVLAPAGALVKANGYLNFIVHGAGVIDKGLYGREVEGQRLRIEGARIDDDWLKRFVDEFSENQRPSLTQMALATHAFAPPLSNDMTSAQRRLFESARLSFAHAFTQLDPIEQAWLLSVMRGGEGTEPVLRMARTSEHRLVKLVYLLGHLRGPQDPMLDAAKRGDDPLIQRVAVIQQEHLRKVQAQQQ